MASVATLGFSIISRYSGGGVASARRDLATLRAQMAAFNNDIRQHTNVLNGIPQRWKAIGAAVVSVAPALIPISAAALQVAASFTSMAAAVGVALGAYGAALAGAVKKTMEMAKAGKALSPVQKEFVGSVNGMNTAWKKFISDTQNMTLTTATAAVRGLTSGISLLTPIVKAIHPEVLKMAQAFEKWMKGDSAKNYSNLIAAAAVPALRNLSAAGRDVLNVLGDGFRAFLPTGVRMTETIRQGAAALREWSDGGGFQRFLAYVRENGPAVHQFWVNFRAALSNVFQTLSQFSGGALHVLTDALRGIAAIDPASVKAFAQALLLMRNPILFLVLNCPPLRDAIIGLLGALNPATIYAIAGAFAAWRVSIMLVNAGLISSPIGWVITALAGLAVAITFIATKTTWFQTAWNASWSFIKTVASTVWNFLTNGLGQLTLLLMGPIGILAILALNWSTIWNGIKTAASAVWNALTIAWNATVSGLSTAWTAVSGALVTAWNAVWNGISTAVRVVWTGLQIAWSAFTGALATAWTTVSGALVTAWNAVWNGISTAARAVWTALQVAWSAFTSALATAWSAVSGALVTAWNFVWNGIKVVAETVWNGLKAAWNLFITGLQVIWSTVSSALVAAWNAVWNGIKVVAETVWNGLKAAWNLFITGLQVIWSTVSSALVTAWNAVWNGIRTAAEAVWNGIKTAWQAVVTFFQTVWSSFSGALSSAWNTFWNGLRTAAQAVWTGLQAAWSAFTNAFRVIWDTLRAWFYNSWSTLWNIVRTAAEAVWNFLKSAWQGFLNTFKSIWDNVRAWFYNSWSTLWNIVKSAAQTVWNALKSAWQSFLNAIKSIWDTVRAWFYNSWTVLWNIVKTAAQTVWNALKTAWQNFLNAVKSIWDNVRAWFYNSWTTLWNIVRDAAQNVWNWLKDRWDDFLNLFKGIWDKFRSWFWDSWTGIWNLVKDFAGKVWHEIGEIIEKAINAVITIINGLIKGFNNITSFLKLDVKVGEIDKVKFNFAEGGMVGLTPYMVGGMAEFAKGGVANLKNGGTLRGYAPGRDTVPAMLSRGEGVLTPEAVRGMGGPGFVHAANRKFAGHRGAGREARAPLSRFTGSHDASQQRGMGKPRGYATGGIVGGVQHFAVGGMTAAALQKAGVSLGLVSQGEYSNGSLSAGTHLGGGAVDLSTTSPATLAALRAAGFAAWIRGPEQGFSPHIHAILMNHPDLSPAAAAQVQDFLAGGDGLGAGGGGGGGVDILGMVMEHVGAILKNVYRGDNPLLNIGGAIAQFFGIGNDEDDGGLFGTGIGPDFGPNVADAVGNVVESVTGIGGQMMEMLGQVVLAALSGDGIAEGLSDAGKEFGKFGGIAGGFGKIAVGLGKKILDEVMPDFLMSKKDESTFNPADFAGGFGDVQAWAPLALQALARAGIPASQLPAFLALMQAESGGNPMAINNWDSNAIMGQASRGLMQVIPGTFAMYRDRTLPNNIFDPLANMTAAANYIRARYGGKVPGSPYALGTPGATSGVHLVGEQGPELLNFRGGETVTPAKETAGILGGGAAPEDLLGQFEMLMGMAQQMSATVQQSWAKVTGAGQTAKSSLTPVHQDLVTQLGTNIPTAISTMQAANSAAWLAMQTSTDTTWATMKAGTFTEAQDHMMVKMPTWGNEMNTAVSTAWDNMGQATATAWEGMKEGTRGPTNWIIDQSYNNGIRSLWNQVAEVIFEDGAKTLPTVATLAKGGPVRGPGGETADRVPAMLSRGEHVWTAREVHRAGGHAAVQQMRQAVMGRSVRGAHGGRGFALGGWLGGVGNVSGSSPAVGTLDLKRGSMMDVVGDHLDAIDQSVKDALNGSFYRRMGGSAGVTSPTDWIRQYVEKDDELNKIGSGGPPWIPGVSDAITSWGGVTVNQRTADMLNMALALGASFSATQGSFSTGVAASAGTHDGGGVVDLVPASNTNVGALRAVGFAAWNRGAAWGSPSFADHIHAVALGDPTVSSGAAAQIQSYLAGGNGLADGGPDNYSGGIPSVDGVAAIGGGGRNVDPADLEQRVVSYDRGGFLQPGYTLAFNGTGKPEPVGHHLEPKGSSGVSINMPITINGSADAAEVVSGIESQVLPKLRQYLTKGTGNN